ncbi:MAG: response regulator [Burkholderiaceae bacterium]|jgi:signal transduction histidine kinase|nr:response regulator [Burkholderiaceae bacterium]MBP6356636.1 response regulator [Burkholderiaceae bacterium]MBP7965812.1 response regulator [Burkholderiaceae bacterium]
MQTSAQNVSERQDGLGVHDVAPTVAAQLLRFTVRQSVKNSYTVWLISFFVALAALSHVPAWISVGWALSVGLAYTIRVLLIVGARDSQTLEAQHGFWLRRYTITTVACAVVVATGPAFLFPAASETARMYMSVLLCCWLAGSMASVGAYAGLFAVYAAVFTGGVAVGWVLSDTTHKVEILVMLALFAVVVITFGRSFARLVSEGVEIRFVNEQLMARLAAAREAAEESSAAKSRFLAAASHDLRQPLHAVAMLNGLLTRPQTPESVADISRHMARSLSTLQRLFSSVLDYSRLEAGAPEPVPTWFALAPLLDRLTAEYMPTAAQKGLALRHDCPMVQIHSDAQILERILRNLIENAIKFTDQGAVTLTAARMDDGLNLTISDTGPGIPDNLKADIFKEYFQACAEKKEEGLGLGLAIVRHLAPLLGIGINVRDNQPRGTCFELCLPRTSVREAPCPVSDAPLAPRAIDLGGLTVLCIDDDPASLHALRALLVEWKASPLMATSPQQAFDEAARNPSIDVILSDYELGAPINGADLILALRERLGPVSGCILTGAAAAIQAHRDGLIEFPVLLKPFAARELREMLEMFKEMR